MEDIQRKVIGKLMKEHFVVNKRVTQHYVDNKKLFEEMVKYTDSYKAAKELGVTPPKVNNYIGECIWRIANKLATKKNFIGYSYREEMVGDAIENCLRYLHNFDPNKTSNPFAYFTQIMYYAFLRRIEKEKKQTYIKYKAMENSIVMNSLVEMAPSDVSHFQAVMTNVDYQKMGDLAAKYETASAAKKIPKKKGVEKFMEDE